jgi:hypothetical protein
VKFAIFIEAPAEQARTEFQNWFSVDFAPPIVASAPTMRGCVYRNVRDSPGRPSTRYRAPATWIFPLMPYSTVTAEVTTLPLSSPPCWTLSGSASPSAAPG